MTWPFENNTNAITGKLAKRSLQADKRRNIFLIVTITLTTALLLQNNVRCYQIFEDSIKQ